MKNSEDNQGRRDFLGKVVKVGLGAVAATTLLQQDLLAIVDGKKKVIAKVKISEHKELAKTGGNILVKDTEAGDVLIVRLKGDKYAVMSNVCPHKKCEVKVKSKDMIQCPCHKSKYAIDGTFQYGPAKKDLKRFPFKIADGTIKIMSK